MKVSSRSSGHDPAVKENRSLVKENRSLALKAFLFSSLLWIVSVSVFAVYLDVDLSDSSRFGVILYGFFLLMQIVLALVAVGFALASLLMNRRGKRIAWAALAMVVLPFTCSAIFLFKLMADRFL